MIFLSVWGGMRNEGSGGLGRGDGLFLESSGCSGRVVGIR